MRERATGVDSLARGLRPARLAPVSPGHAAASGHPSSRSLRSAAAAGPPPGPSGSGPSRSARPSLRSGPGLPFALAGCARAPQPQALLRRPARSAWARVSVAPVLVLRAGSVPGLRLRLRRAAGRGAGSPLGVARPPGSSGGLLAPHRRPPSAAPAHPPLVASACSLRSPLPLRRPRRGSLRSPVPAGRVGVAAIGWRGRSPVSRPRRSVGCVPASLGGRWGDAAPPPSPPYPHPTAGPQAGSWLPWRQRWRATLRVPMYLPGCPYSADTIQIPNIGRRQRPCSSSPLS